MKAGQMVAGKYRLNRILGTGGMATVWSATNVFTERQFAIKFLLPLVARTPDAGRRFLLEAKVSARINHPNIIEVIDVGHGDDGALFLVMELLKGTSLDEALRGANPALAVGDFLVIMRDVATALAAAHRAGVIHRDLKPSNIFLHKDRDGRPVAKVLDFGVSKILDNSADASLTVVGTILGSPLYMSPEQALGAEGIDQRTDVFAFGAILFEGLCGERPYSATNLNGLIVAIATTQPKNIDELAPLLPAGLRALVRDCLVTDKTRRVASFDPIVERLNFLLDGLAADVRLPVRKSSQLTSDSSSLRDVSFALQDTSLPPSRRTTSVSPHSLPTPEAPLATSSPARNGSPAGRRGSKRPRAWAWGGGSALGLVALAAVMSAGFLGGRVGRTWPATASHAAALGSDLSNSSLATRHIGRLSVASTPTWCALSLDGTLRGLTPIASFELSAGAHKLDCVPPNGKPQTATVTVSEGDDAHYQFALADSR
jgi:serine/threonine-protein kinase